MSQRRRVIAAVLMSSASLLVAASDAQAAPAPPPPDAKVDPRLLELRADLMRKDRDAVLADVKAFRPLCDAEGYPLVGNLATKGVMFQPSAFCAHVRGSQQGDK